MEGKKIPGHTLFTFLHDGHYSKIVTITSVVKKSKYKTYDKSQSQGNNHKNS